MQLARWSSLGQQERRHQFCRDPSRAEAQAVSNHQTENSSRGGAHSHYGSFVLPDRGSGDMDARRADALDPSAALREE